MRGPKLNCQSGQLAIVLPLSLAIAIAGTLMWGYLQILYVQSSASILSSGANSLAKTLNARIQNYLKGPYVTCADPLHDQFPSEPNQIFSAFRDFKLGTPVPPNPPSPVVWRYDASPVPATGIPCLLGDASVGQDPAEVLNLASVSILIARIGAADPIGMSSQIEVSISTTTKNAAGGTTSNTKVSKISHQYMMKAGRLSNYSLVLLQNNSANTANPQISVSGNATVEFMGSVFVPSFAQQSISSITRIPASGNPTVTFDAPVDVRAAELKFSADPTPLMETAAVSKVFTLGINFNVFGNYYPGAPGFPAFAPTDPAYGGAPTPTLNTNVNVSGNIVGDINLPIAFIPMVDPPPDQNGWDPMIFTQPLDYTDVYTTYSYVTGSVTPLLAAQYYPIPDIQWNAVQQELDSAYGNNPDWAPNNGADKRWGVAYARGVPYEDGDPYNTNLKNSGSFTCTDPIGTIGGGPHAMCFDPVAAGAIADIPDGNTVPGLNVTCGPNLNRIPVFVYQRLGWPGYGAPDTGDIHDDNWQNWYPGSLTIEFDKSCGSIGCDRVFCGLVATPVLNIVTPNNAPADQVYVIYGNIVTSQINVTGGGHIVFANPVEGNNVPGMDFSLDVTTVSQSYTNLFAQFQRLASSTGVNFFTPFAFNYAYRDRALVNPVPHSNVFPVSAASYIQPCMTDKVNVANDGVEMSNTTYCPLSSTSPPSVDSIPWGNDTLAMSLTVTQ